MRRFAHVLLLAGTSTAAWAQPPADDAIVVTGTRSSGRTVAQSTSPIDIVSSRALATSPSVDLNDKIAQEIPSFSVQRLPGFDGASFIRPASLRNLSPDQTLVLVNGRRRHRSAFIDIVNQGAQPIDLSQIPEIAVKRSEVLRDGASAQYGSDAIAGVINLLLDERPGTRVSTVLSRFYAGDGFNAQVAARSGITVAETGHLVAFGQYLHAEPTDRSVGVRHRVGQPRNETGQAGFDAAVPLGDVAEVYAFGTGGTGRSAIEFRFHPVGDTIYRRSFYQDGANAIFPDWSLTKRYPEGIGTSLTASSRDAAITGGVRGTPSDSFRWDASGSYGRNRIRYTVNDTINATFGPLSPTRFDAGTLVSDEATANLDFVWRPDIGLAAPVNVAFGAQHRRESYRARAGEPLSYEVGPLADLTVGAYTFPGLSAASAISVHRHSNAGYVDVEADAIRRLTLAAAARYERFSDFGDNFSYKLAGVWRATRWMRLRTTWSTGFRAPTPGQQRFTKITQSNDTTAPPPFPIITTGLVSPTDPIAIANGGRPLKAELSRNLSAGIVLTAAAGLTIAVDAYRIKVRDRLGLTQQIALPVDAAFDRIQFFVNGFDTRTRGIDAVASWNKAVGDRARLMLTGAYSYIDTDVLNGNPIVATPIVRDVIERQRPRHRFIGSATLDRGPLHLFGRARFYGPFVDALPYDQRPFINQRVDGEVFLDVSFGYDLDARTLVTVGLENLLGNYPDRATSVISRFGEKYPKTRPFDEDGGRYYLRISRTL